MKVWCVMLAILWTTIKVLVYFIILILMLILFLPNTYDVYLEKWDRVVVRANMRILALVKVDYKEHRLTVSTFGKVFFERPKSDKPEDKPNKNKADKAKPDKDKADKDNGDIKVTKLATIEIEQQPKVSEELAEYELKLSQLKLDSDDDLELEDVDKQLDEVNDVLEDVDEQLDDKVNDRLSLDKLSANSVSSNLLVDEWHIDFGSMFNLDAEFTQVFDDSWVDKLKDEFDNFDRKPQPYIVDEQEGKKATDYKQMLKVGYYSEYRNEAFEQMFTTLLQFLRMIMPKRFNFDVEIGAGEPDATGKIMASVSPFYGVYADYGTITGNFSESGVWGNVNIAGRFFVIQLIWIVAGLLLNKPFREYVQQILDVGKDEDKDGRE
ncbi:MAG: hypothetical protein ATN34_01105 [Epulopiscium sp. Nele67-Bin002]|nr:MAG: hypothetical protein ATN34_01105 [Epulopiscium sp. Nele67-Bin002]